MATMTASEVRQDLAEEVAKVSVWISFYIVLLHLFLKKDFCRQSAGHIKKASLYPPSFYLYPPSFYLYPSTLLSVSSILLSVSIHPFICILHPFICILHPFFCIFHPFICALSSLMLVVWLGVAVIYATVGSNNEWIILC